MHNLLNWYETEYTDDLWAAWRCDAGDHRLRVEQRSAVNFSAAVRDAVSGEMLARLDERFQTWGQAALWAEAQSGMGGTTSDKTGEPFLGASCSWCWFRVS